MLRSQLRVVVAVAVARRGYGVYRCCDRSKWVVSQQSREYSRATKGGPDNQGRGCPGQLTAWELGSRKLSNE